MATTTPRSSIPIDDEDVASASNHQSVDGGVLQRASSDIDVDNVVGDPHQEEEEGAAVEAVAKEDNNQDAVLNPEGNGVIIRGNNDNCATDDNDPYNSVGAEEGVARGGLNRDDDTEFSSVSSSYSNRMSQAHQPKAIKSNHDDTATTDPQIINEGGVASGSGAGERVSYLFNAHDRYPHNYFTTFHSPLLDNDVDTLGLDWEAMPEPGGANADTASMAISAITPPTTLPPGNATQDDDLSPPHSHITIMDAHQEEGACSYCQDHDEDDPSNDGTKRSSHQQEAEAEGVARGGLHRGDSDTESNSANSPSVNPKAIKSTNDDNNDESILKGDIVCSNDLSSVANTAASSITCPTWVQTNTSIPHDRDSIIKGHVIMANRGIATAVVREEEDQDAIVKASAQRHRDSGTLACGSSDPKIRSDLEAGNNEGHPQEGAEATSRPANHETARTARSEEESSTIGSVLPPPRLEGIISLPPGAYHVAGRGHSTRVLDEFEEPLTLPSIEDINNDNRSRRLEEEIDRLGIHRVDAEAVPVNDDSFHGRNDADVERPQLVHRQNSLEASVSMVVDAVDATPIQTTKILGKEIQTSNVKISLLVAVIIILAIVTPVIIFTSKQEYDVTKASTAAGQDKPLAKNVTEEDKGQGSQLQEPSINDDLEYPMDIFRNCTAQQPHQDYKPCSYILSPETMSIYHPNTNPNVRMGWMFDVIVGPVTSPQLLNDPKSAQRRGTQGISKWLGYLGNLQEADETSYAEIFAYKDDLWFRERYALFVLYYSLGGEGWTRYGGKDGFIELKDHCMAENNMIVCDEDFHVVELNLDANNLTGTVPSEIQHFKSLQTLNLNSNPGLGGWLPRTLHELPHLKTLWMEDTDIEGGINRLCTTCEGCDFRVNLDLIVCSCCA